MIGFLDELFPGEINVLTELRVAEGPQLGELMGRIRSGLRRLYQTYGSADPALQDPRLVAQHLDLVPDDPQTRLAYFAVVGAAHDLDLLMYEAEVIGELDRVILDRVLHAGPRRTPPVHAHQVVARVLDAVFERGAELLMRALDDLARGAERDYLPPPEHPHEDTAVTQTPATPDTPPAAEVGTYTHWAYFALPEHAKACAAELRDGFAAQTRIELNQPPTLPGQEWLLRAVIALAATGERLGAFRNDVEAVVQRHDGTYDGGAFGSFDIETGAYIMPPPQDAPGQPLAGEEATDAG